MTIKRRGVRWFVQFVREDAALMLMGDRAVIPDAKDGYVSAAEARRIVELLKAGLPTAEIIVIGD